MERWAREAAKRAAAIGEALKVAAFDISWSLRDAAKTGFGVPGFMASTASFGVATIAAVGTASVAFDLTGKVFGKMECTTCNGWEAMQCTTCKGSGKVRFNVKESLLSEAERASTSSVADAVLEGRAEVEYVPASVGIDWLLPWTACPRCEASGVVPCRACDGNAWKPKFTFDEISDAPWLASNVLRKMKPVVMKKRDNVIPDPLMDMFDGEETEESEQKEKERAYDEARKHIESRVQGWEDMQEILFHIDPERAAADPVIVADPAHYKAQMTILNEVSKLPVPPRPTEWLKDIEFPLDESDWTAQQLKDPKVREEKEVLLRGQDEFLNAYRDQAWELSWRRRKAEEMTASLVNAHADGAEAFASPSFQTEVTKPHVDKATPLPTAAPVQTKPAVQKKPEAKKRPDEDRKRRERQERAERMARQAADREAALARAKASKGRS